MTTRRGATRIPVYLATLSHPDLAALAGEVDGFTPAGELPVANYRHPFVSRGVTYLPGFFRPSRPELGTRRGTLRLAIDNVDQRVTYALETLTGAATLTLEMVYADAPDTVQRRWPNYELKTADIDAPEVSAVFGPPDTSGRFMGLTINPNDYPGAYS